VARRHATSSPITILIASIQPFNALLAAEQLTIHHTPHFTFYSPAQAKYLK
jgi:hypothetical protein